MGPVPVAFVSSHARLGGSERYLELLLEKLEPSWIELVICLEHGPFVERLRTGGHSVAVIPTSNRLGIVASAWKLRRLLHEARAPEVVHANGVKAALVCALATWNTELSVLWAKHDFSFDGWFARLLARRCAQVVCPTEAAARTFGPARNGKIRVVHHGIDEIRVERSAARRLVLETLDAPSSSSVVALVGRLDPVKGHLELVEILPELLKRVPQARVAFVGGQEPSLPGYRLDVERRIAELGLMDSVTFLGYRKDASGFMSGCDVVAMPSVPVSRHRGREASPFVALEALAVGTPVVGYADGGLPELLGDCGRLVPAGDRAALRDAIADVLLDDALSSRLSRCGPERVRARFSLARWIEETTARYRELADA